MGPGRTRPRGEVLPGSSRAVGMSPTPRTQVTFRSSVDHVPEDNFTTHGSQTTETRHPSPRTLGELRASGHVFRSVRDEIRNNLLTALREGRDPWPGIVGFESTVIPQLERALIAGHDVVMLGERCLLYTSDAADE